MAGSFSRLAILVLAVAAASCIISVTDAAKSKNPLASLDFGSIIGGPLQAVVKAQAAAAATTINFVESIGFENAPNSGGATQPKVPRYFNFGYESKTADGGAQEMTYAIPVLACVPIPYLQVDSVDIEFNAAITSIETSQSSSDTFKSSSASGNSTTRAQVSHQQTQRNNDYQRSYAMRVFVHATQPEMPIGTRKLLDKLLSAVSDKSVTSSS